MSFTYQPRETRRPLGRSPSLLALSVAMAFTPALSFAATANSDDTIVVEESTTPGDEGQDQDYSVKTTTTGTKMLLVQRDIPQSVSVISQQRMKDQELNSIEEVLDNTTGVSVSRIDSHRTNIFSRGFFVSNFAFDDMPTFLDDRWNFGDTAGDTAIFESIEVVRGAAGLMSGTGNPSAYVNMVRKHADSREFKGSASATYGSWDKQRYVLDLQAPLSESGNVRGRVIAGYQDNDSWLERNHYRKNSSPASSMPISQTPPPSLWLTIIRRAKKTAQPGAASLPCGATAAAPISAVNSIPPLTGLTPMRIRRAYSPT